MSERKSIIVDGVEYVRADSAEMATDTNGLKYCIVRCRDAGVHAGFVAHHEGREVKLLKARRLWRWWGKTLSGLAQDGSFAPDDCKYANEIPEITVLDACEIITCSSIGMKSIREDVGEWTNE